MNKKNYTTCDIMVVDLHTKAPLLTASQPTTLTDEVSEADQLSRTTGTFSIWGDEDDDDE